VIFDPLCAVSAIFDQAACGWVNGDGPGGDTVKA
jgi:hypothetical protein